MFLLTGNAIHCFCEQGRLYIVCKEEGDILFLRTWKVIHCFCEQGRLLFCEQGRLYIVFANREYYTSFLRTGNIVFANREDYT